MPGRIVTTNRTAVADGAGRAVVRFDGPGDAWEYLAVDVISCTSDSTSRPTLTLYRGLPSSGVIIATNPDGITGAFDGGGVSDRLAAGESWSLSWAGADPGATCTAALSGVIQRR